MCHHYFSAFLFFRLWTRVEACVLLYRPLARSRRGGRAADADGADGPRRLHRARLPALVQRCTILCMLPEERIVRTTSSFYC